MVPSMPCSNEPKRLIDAKRRLIAPDKWIKERINRGTRTSRISACLREGKVRR
jgi:hypothetical protein